MEIAIGMGGKSVIDFHLHCSIELGLAALID